MAGLTSVRRVGGCALSCLMLAGAGWGQEVDDPTALDAVAPVSGPSLLTKLKGGVDLTSLGRIGMIGQVPAEIEQRFADPDPSPDSPGWWLEDGFSLSGADLYRLNCRSCHGASAQGLGAAVPALIDPVKAASPEYVQERMEARGRSIPDELAEKLAARAELSLRHRLLKGGLVMPPFGHLKGKEVDALLEFLEAIAGVSKEQTHLRVREPAERVGAHVVKSTCLICHDATAGRYRANSVDQAIPALDGITNDFSAREFVRKVRTGTPREGEPRGRMPQYTFLSEKELEAAYLYLMAYPPQRDGG